MSKVSKFADMNYYIINLDDRPDRLRRVTKELRAVGIPFTRVPAIRTIPGRVGCARSHVRALMQAEGDVVTIFEDDVKFIGPRELIHQTMWELPEDWDMLYLGASPQEPLTAYSDHLFRLGKSKTTHAIVWHRRPGGAMEYVIEHEDSIDVAIDNWLSREVHPRFNCFLAYPLICTQHQTSSDTCRRMDASSIERNYRLYVK